jgi:hypothetical protein
MLQSGFHDTASSCPLQYILIAMWKADSFFTKFGTKSATPQPPITMSLLTDMSPIFELYDVLRRVVLLTRSREVLGSALGLIIGCPEVSYAFLSPSRQMSRQCLARTETTSLLIHHRTSLAADNILK